MNISIEEHVVNSKGFPHDTNEIVITGISGRFPDCNNVEDFKRQLFNGVDLITDDDRRWPPGIYGTPERTGKLNNLDHFDAKFFGIHSKQAQKMDPQLRLLLETTFEAILDAGINPSEIRGSKTGVFIGVTGAESFEFWDNDTEGTDGYGMLGNCRAMFPNRISYTFDFHGPSYAIDSACSSCLVALQRGVASIQAGESDSAIIGASNICLKPQTALQFVRLGMLSGDGKCKTFDASGSGYVRSESVGVFYIQKAKDARRIYVSILGAKVNTDGYKEEGITYPSGKMQQNLIREIYEGFGIDPSVVSYIETHGTGTKVGDPQEMNAIAEVFCQNRSQPLLIGSVKSNMGHAEAASGFCSLAKLVIAMENELIPANLHFENPNTQIPGLTNGQLKVVTKNEHWKGGLVGLNSFGFGGSNVHVVLRSNPKHKAKQVAEQIPRIVTVSGRTIDAVSHLLEKVEYYKYDAEFLGLLDKIHSSAVAGHNYRGYSILGTNIQEVSPYSSNKRAIWFIYSGMGSQYPKLVRNLMSIEIFNNSIMRAGDFLLQQGLDLRDLLINGDEEAFGNVLNSFVCITAVQIALTDLLKWLGIEPDGIIGHSVGEIACAYADGTITSTQAIMLAYYRGRAILEANLDPGAMASVGLTWEECTRRCPPNVFPACHNHRDNVTISGPPKIVEEFVQLLQSENIFATSVKSSGCAFHCQHIAKIVPGLKQYLESVIPLPRPRTSRWISTSFPESMWNTPLAQMSSAYYHLHNTISPVLFYEGIQHIPKNAITVEIAPHCILQAIIKRALDTSITNCCLMKRNENDQLKFFLTNIGKLYNAGSQPKISSLYRPVYFPVSRGTPMIAPLVKWEHSIKWRVPDFSGSKIKSGSNKFNVNLNRSEDQYLLGHEIDGRLFYPGAGYLVLAWKAFAKLKCKHFEKVPVIIENVRIKRPIFVPTDRPIDILVDILEGSGEFEVSFEDAIVASGKIRALTMIASEESVSELPKNPFPLTSKDVYKELRLRGYDYKDIFCGIINSDYEFMQGMLKWDCNWVSFIDNMIQISVLKRNERHLYLPTGFSRVIINPSVHTEVVSRLPESDKIPFHVNRDSGIVKAGAIEVHEMKVTLAPRQSAKTPPKLDSYEFIPCHYTITSDDEHKSLRVALTVALQIVLENTEGILSMKIVEISGEASRASVLQSLLEGESAISTDYVVINPAESEVANLEHMGVRTLNKDCTKGAFERDAHLVVVTDAMQNPALLTNSVASLTPSGFLLTEENEPSFDEDVIMVNGMEIVSIQVVASTSKVYILLRKRVVPLATPIVLQIMGNNFEWVGPLQNAIKECSGNGGKIYLVAHGEVPNGLVGMVNCLNKEHYGNNVRSYFIQSNKSEPFDLSSPFYALQIKKDLIHNILNTDNIWGTFRHIPLDRTSTISHVEHAYINTTTRGDLSTLTWIESPLKYYKSVENAQLCCVYYAPLNFRDVMIATGKLPPNGSSRNQPTQECTSSLGLEFSGRDSTGRRVMGIVDSCSLATSCISDPDLLWEVPDNWSLAEAATVPVAYGTSYYALLIRGQMRRGESILIHAGAGGVGQASIAISLDMGCTVYTTVGSQSKRDFLKKIFPQLDEYHIGNSRDTSFEKFIMKQTSGRGVDLILNSLAAEQLQASLRCLALGGRFLEIGKVDVLKNSALGMNIFLNNTSFHGIFLDGLSSSAKQEVQGLVYKGIMKGTVKPLPSTIFSENEVEQAFRFMASGKHVGKVVIKIRNEGTRDRVAPSPKCIAAVSRIYMNPDKIYIIIGGLGGFGLELANWLIMRGATKIVLTSRSGTKNGYQELCLKRWLKAGVKVIISTNDVSSTTLANSLITDAGALGPVGGIFNLAVVIRDALIENLTTADFELVAKAKVESTMYLDVASRQLAPHLDYFVVFSSIVCGRGNIGQANYGYANSAMERLVEKRKLDGFPGIAIQWGAIGDTGYAVETIGEHVEVGGYMPQSISSCLSTLDVLLTDSHAVVSSAILAQRSKRIGDTNTSSILSSIANVLGVDTNTVCQSTSLGDMGMDSLMLTEIKQILERNYEIIFNFQEIRSLTFQRLIDLHNGASSTPGVTDKQTDKNRNRADTNGPIEIMPKQVVVQLSNKLGAPSWAIHAIEGTVERLKVLSELVDSCIYGLQCTEECPVNTITDLAKYYRKQVTKVQKHGPYLIIGYSFGACIAMEIGLQLEKLGNIVKLILIDGSHAHIASQIDKIQGGYAVKQCRILITKELFEIESFDERVAHVANILSAILQNTVADIKSAAAGFYHRIIAAVGYVPDSSFGGEITLIRAKNSFPELQEDLGLNSVCKQKVKVIPLDGNHYTILEGANVGKIARVINEIVNGS